MALALKKQFGNTMTIETTIWRWNERKVNEVGPLLPPNVLECYGKVVRYTYIYSYAKEITL